MQRVKLYLKCGHVVEFDCDHFVTQKNGPDIVKFEWKNGNADEILHCINVDEIVAITYSKN